jgi:DNA-binding NtrC family response regulator
MNISVLVVDDEENIRWALQNALSDNGFQVVCASSGADALARLNDGHDVMLLDFRLPDMDGIEILKRLKTMESPPLVIMMTAFGTIQLAVDAMHEGAYYFITKPFKKEDLLLQLERAAEIIQLRIAGDQRRKEMVEASGFEAIVGESAAIEKAKKAALSVASVPDTTVLILGETGTGKEVFAKAVHLASDRADGNFEAINCASIPETLLESELFGYMPGAFTDAKKRKKGKVELASGGTLFLD